jgi:serine/threonine protein kinase
MIDNGSYVPLSVAKMNDTLRKFRQVDSQIPRSDIRYIRQIGQGNFGVVFLGMMHRRTSSDSIEETSVAVKTLKDECQEALDDFAREARIMMQLEHPNIIKMYGVSTDNSPYYLIFEYMDLGDLSKYLREHAGSRQRRLMDPSGYRRSRTESTLSDDPPSLSHCQLVDMCKQIAAGMEYLSANNHVHRDLACRNCLVKSCAKADETCSGVIVKIGDFGMSHGLYQKNYYRVEGQAVLPIRWMSPEAVIFGKFSTAGDVWSFGVTMWEIFSFAMQPYFGLSNEEVTKHIRRGQHLEQPNYCPDKIYGTMKMCWELEPDSRPSFFELQNHINEIHVSLSSESSSESSGGDDHAHHSPPSARIDGILEEEEEYEGEDNVFEESPPEEDAMRRIEMGLAHVTPPPPHYAVGGGGSGVECRLAGDPFEYRCGQQQQPQQHHLVLDRDDTTTSSSSDSGNGSATESHA